MNLLRERLTLPADNNDATNLASREPSARASRAYQEMKMQGHQLLRPRIDLEAMEGMTDSRLREELRTMVERLLTEENLLVNSAERRDLVRDIQHEMLGLGPLEPLLADP